MQVIILKNPDGSVGIMVPTPNSGLTVAQVAAKDVPAGVPFEIIDASLVPADRSFRDAWGHDLQPRMDKARDIAQEKLRMKAKALLADMESDERASRAKCVKAKSDIQSAATVSEIKAILAGI